MVEMKIHLFDSGVSKSYVNIDMITNITVSKINDKGVVGIHYGSGKTIIIYDTYEEADKEAQNLINQLNKKRRI